MSHSNGKITAPVSFADVNAVLGASHTDLAAICKDSQINKFARYKPISYPSGGLLTEAQRRSVAHGIVMPTPVTGSALNANLVEEAASYDWGYTKPSGGANSPYRLHDFGNTVSLNSIGYNHNCVPPIQCVYPKDGWTFMRGGSARNLIINFDLDPSNDTDSGDSNLQATDFIAGGLNLNEWKFIAAVEDYGLFAADNYILSDGELSGDNIVVNIPAGTGSLSKNVYIAMYRFNSGQYELLPLPKLGDYNPEQMTLNIIDDAQASGGGISGGDTEEMFKNVEFSYALDGVYHTAWDCTDNGIAKWALKCNGSLYVKMKLSNTSGSTSTVQRSQLQLDMNGQGLVSATTMYNSSKQSVSSVQIPNNSSVTIYLFFDAIFTGIGYDWNNSNKNSSWSMDFVRNGATLFGGDIYAYKASDGWTER